MIGGAGDDQIVGGAGFDTMFGGAGADVFVFAAGDSTGGDRITDFRSVDGDVIDLTAFAGLSEADISLSKKGVTWTVGVDVNHDEVSDFSFSVLTPNGTLDMGDFMFAGLMVA